MSHREHVSNEALKPADVIISCNNVLWYNPVTVVAILPVSAGGKPDKGILLSSVSAAHGFQVDVPYAAGCEWLVERQ